MDLAEQLLSELHLGYTIGDQVEEIETCQRWTVWGINRANKVILHNEAGEVRVVHADQLRQHVPKEESVPLLRTVVSKYSSDGKLWLLTLDCGHTVDAIHPSDGVVCHVCNPLGFRNEPKT